MADSSTVKYDHIQLPLTERAGDSKNIRYFIKSIYAWILRFGCFKKLTIICLSLYALAMLTLVLVDRERIAKHIRFSVPATLEQQNNHQPTTAFIDNVDRKKPEEDPHSKDPRQKDLNSSDWSKWESNECFDPYAGTLLQKVIQNCSHYRFITIPDDGGRFGHGMSQLYVLLVFHRLLNAKKSSTGIGSNVTHVPVLPRHKEMLLCELFQRPSDVYLSLPVVTDACGPISTVGASFSDWETKFDELAYAHVHFNTWPMPRMYLEGNSDLYDKVFKEYSGWSKKAREIIAGYKRNFTNTSETVFVHLRRTDYLNTVQGWWNFTTFNGSHVNALIEHKKLKYPNALYVVVSDDEQWCKSNLNFTAVEHMVLVQVSRPELAFAIMRQCNHSVVTYGSYGLWAGILGGGHMTRLLPKIENKTVIQTVMQNTEEKLPNVDFYYYP